MTCVRQNENGKLVQFERCTSFVWLLQICHGVEIFSAPADLQMQMGVLRALNIGGISRCSQLLSALDGIASRTSREPSNPQYRLVTPLSWSMVTV